MSAIHQAVPFWNQVVYRTAGYPACEFYTCMAIGSAAIHASSALRSELFLGEHPMELLPIFDPFQWITVAWKRPAIFHKPRRCRHLLFLLSVSPLECFYGNK